MAPYKNVSLKYLKFMKRVTHDFSRSMKILFSETFSQAHILLFLLN